MIDGFVNGGLVAGAALAAVPLIIHLLNRQRHRPLAWAAMRFVLAALRRTRRRARIEELLLLLLRMAAVALLALAVARPFVGAQSPLAGLTESRRDLVLVLDGSASTGYRESVESVFERITARAREILLELDSSRGDRARLVLAADHPRLLSWRTPEEALSLLGTLAEPTDESLDLARAVGEIARLAEEDAAGGGERGLEVRLLGDLQRKSFLPDLPPESGAEGREEASPPALLEQLDRLRELGLLVVVEDLGPSSPTPANLGVVSLETIGPLLGPGVPIDVGVTVANWDARTASVRLALVEDGERRPSQLLEVPGRGRARAVFTVTFRAPGPHTLEARLDSDRLEVDDSRAQVVQVPPPVRTLLVNGEPAPEIDRDELGLLIAALEPPEGDGPVLAGGSAPFELRTIEPDELLDPDLDLADFDVIVLANAELASVRAVERLEQRVAAGASLWITVGDRVDAARYNALLHRPDGSGLLPAELGRPVAVADRRESYFRVKEFDPEHPVLAFFADERWRPLLTEVPIFEFMPARPIEGARVLARLDDEGGHPLLIERGFDRGRVLLLTTTIDPEWNRLSESPKTLIPLAHEMVRYGGVPRAPSPNVSVGEPLSPEVEGFPRGLSLVRPDGSRRPLRGEPELIASGVWRLPPVEDTGRAGLYRIEMQGSRGSLPFAVQLDPGEGDLERISAGELESLHPALTLVAEGAAGREAGADEPSGRGELWRALALACFVALIFESLWAAWLGRRRSRIG